MDDPHPLAQAALDWRWLTDTMRDTVILVHPVGAVMFEVDRTLLEDLESRPGDCRGIAKAMNKWLAENRAGWVILTSENTHAGRVFYFETLSTMAASNA